MPLEVTERFQFGLGRWYILGGKGVTSVIISQMADGRYWFDACYHAPCPYPDQGVKCELLGEVPCMMKTPLEIMHKPYEVDEMPTDEEIFTLLRKWHWLEFGEGEEPTDV